MSFRLLMRPSSHEYRNVVALSPKTRAHLEALFAPPDVAAAERLLVSRCGAQLPGMARVSPFDLERIRFAALRLSRGQLRELKSAVALAETDWRDLLVAADFAEDAGAHHRWTPKMSKADFYVGKVVDKILWYLHEPELPKTLRWARLRVFVGGSADSTFSLDGPLYGFDRETYASYILTEDEYACFSTFDEEDECSAGIRVAEVEPPQWLDPEDKLFEYLGIY